MSVAERRDRRLYATHSGVRFTRTLPLSTRECTVRPITRLNPRENCLARWLRLRLASSLGALMDWTEVKAHWPAHRAAVAHRWQRLSERELDEIAGDRQRLCERIQEVYGIGAEDAQGQISAWEDAQRTWDPSSADGPAPASLTEVASGTAGKASDPDAERLVSTGTFPAQPDSLHEQTDAQRSPCAEHGYMDDEAQREKDEPADSGAGT